MCFILLFAFLLLSVKRCATFNHGTGTVVLICKLSPQILEWHAVRFDCVLQTVFERVISSVAIILLLTLKVGATGFRTLSRDIYNFKFKCELRA